MDDFAREPSSVGPDPIERAEHLLDADRYDLAEKLLRRSLAGNPTSAILHLQMSRAHNGLKNPVEAEREAREAIACDPELAGAHGYLGYLLSDAGKNREAEEQFLVALKLEPGSAGLLAGYASLLFKTGHLDKAEALIRAALREDPERSHSHSVLALVLAEKGKQKAAHSHGKIGLALDPSNDVSHLALGASYLGSGHPFKARRHLREALRIDSSDASAEQAFLDADRACRLTYLPLYHWSLVIDKLPGKQFAVWGAIVVFLMVARSAKIPSMVTGWIAFSYLGFCVYTWVADPLTSLWIKLRPPR